MEQKEEVLAGVVQGVRAVQLRIRKVLNPVAVLQKGGLMQQAQQAQQATSSRGLVSGMRCKQAFRK
jgi:hypothetical protein